MRATFKVLFISTLFISIGYSQGLYFPKGESGPILSFNYGESKNGFLSNAYIGYSFNGKISTGLAFQQATYAPTMVDWDYFSIPLFYHLLKPVKEGDMTFDLLGSYSFGNFTNPDYDSGNWERIGHEFEIGVRLGNRLIDSEQFVTYPKLALEYFWSIITFYDGIESETEDYAEEGTRITASFDMLIAFDEDKYFLLTPIIRYNRETFIWGGGIGFVWGRLH